MHVSKSYYLGECSVLDHIPYVDFLLCVNTLVVLETSDQFICVETIVQVFKKILDCVFNLFVATLLITVEDKVFSALKHTYLDTSLQMDIAKPESSDLLCW
jgi:hypothetical protein